jgi:4-hydroxybenzoate polyprenyltransferase
MSKKPSFFGKLLIILEMIKFEHTVFALPFALMAAAIAAKGFPAWNKLGWILLAMVGARSAAMTFNRIADQEIDAANPRTAKRALPAGIVKRTEAWIFTLVSIGLLVFSAYMLNPLALMLSPVALLVLLGYSYTKRFTALSHVVLGLALGIAPSAAWIAIKGTLELPPALLTLAVICWTAGFDIIYSLQDLEFDRKQGLFSIPKTLGPARALFVSRIMHFSMVIFLSLFGIIAGLGAVYYVGVCVVALFLIYEQSLVKPDDISRVNFAFFTLNGFVSIGLFLFTVADMVF